MTGTDVIWRRSLRRAGAGNGRAGGKGHRASYPNQGHLPSGTHDDVEVPWKPSSPRCVSTTAGTSWTSVISTAPGTSSWPAGSPTPPRPESSSRTRWCSPRHGDDCTPSSRTVLCKDVDERGVVFYTNYTSAKSHELRSIRRAAATFPWYAAATAGEPARRRRAGRPGGDPRLLGDAAAGLAAGRVGVGAVDLRARPRRPRRRRSRPPSAASPTPTRCRCRRTGAGGGSSRTGSSSGRAGRNRMHDRLRFEQNTDRPVVAGPPARPLTHGGFTQGVEWQPRW